jgi:protein tyrosine kinase modulator
MDQMMENRELTMDDYLAMLRRRLKVILIPTLLTPLVGFAVSYAFAPKFTSQATVLVEEQKVPEGYVKPVVTDDFSQRITRLEQRALSSEELRPMIEKLKLAQGPAVNGVIDRIRNNVTIQAVQAAVIASPLQNNKGDVPGFNVNFTADNPREAQAVCSELTNIIIRENFADVEQAAQNTAEFLSRQADDASHNLAALDAKLADFKKRYIGQLPGDEDNNLKILMGLNSQLDANTQTLNRAQQDKAYTESLLAQQIAAWKSSDSSTDPRTLQKQMADLQTQLLTLEARYTDDYPDVIKTKKDIQALQKKIDSVNAAAANPSGVKDNGNNLSEPPEIQQLRLQVHQYQDTIAQATRNQQRIEEQIKTFQGRVALSPAIEEQYKELTRDYDSAQKTYNDLLTKKSQADTQLDMERDQQGEQMRVLRPADLPDSPSFPNRLLFAGGGLAGGLVIGMGLAMWFEFRDQLVRTEDDVVAILELPVLSQVPWLGTGASPKYGKTIKPKTEKETVEV